MAAAWGQSQARWALTHHVPLYLDRLQTGLEQLRKELERKCASEVPPHPPEPALPASPPGPAASAPGGPQAPLPHARCLSFWGTGIFFLPSSCLISFGFQLACCWAQCWETPQPVSGSGISTHVAVWLGLLLWLLSSRCPERPLSDAGNLRPPPGSTRAARRSSSPTCFCFWVGIPPASPQLPWLARAQFSEYLHACG